MRLSLSGKAGAIFGSIALLAASAQRVSADDNASAPVTFAKQVAPILQAHCQQCHRPGEAAPTSFLSHETTRPWAKSIKKAVTERTMPPWHADPHLGTFANDRRLTEQEIGTLVAWVDGGSPMGDAKDLPKPIEFLEGWNIAKPDLVLTMEKPYDVAATGILDYQHIALPLFPEDRWVTNIEIRPGNRLVAHHINLFVERPAPEGKKPTREFITGFVPGGIPTNYPAGTAVFFEKGSKFILQAHYVTNGTAQTDQTSVGFVFSRQPVQKRIYNGLVSNYGFKIPPQDPNFEVRATLPVGGEPITLIGTMVHMHLRGKDYKFVAHYPDGREEPLMSVPKYDFNWQMGYVFKDQPKLPAGAKIEGIAHMDNSPGNPFNPDPTATVKYGPQTFDEMVMGFVYYTKDNESLAETLGKEHLGPLATPVNPGSKTTSGGGE